ncbi:BTB/POZ domain-containing protein 17-like isoform X1 [Haliotis asinina]|uniref:BTB/POZ domain-containing protein 17-like isoform X1 n=2 Tax=Haliotis asinina TaxID=109174 RepID=UPI0035326565
MGNLFWPPFSKSRKMESPPAKRHHPEAKDEGLNKKQNLTLETIKDEAAFVSRFSALYNSSNLSDLVLRVGRDRYYSHRFILITASDVFEAMLNQRRWVESQEPEIDLTEDPECAPVFGMFLRYLYSGSVQVSTDTVLPILLLADKYSITTLRESCIEYMMRHIVESPDTNRTLTWYQYAKMTGQEKLKEICQKFILSNFDVILDAPDWHEMTKTELVEFLSSSDLVVLSEIHLWNKVEKWLTCEENRDSLAENLKDILPLLRFNMILPKNLLTIESSPLCSKYTEHFAEKLNQAYRHHSLMMDCGDVCENREQFRNYYSKEYHLCFPFLLENYQGINKINSRITVECHARTHYMPSNQSQDSCTEFTAYFFPRGFYNTITLYGTYMNRQSDATTFKLCRKFSDQTALKADVTLVLYGRKNSVRYIAYTFNMSHLFGKESSTLAIENIIDLDKLLQEDSPYLIDGNLDGKLFVKIQDMGPHLLDGDTK